MENNFLELRNKAKIYLSKKLENRQQLLLYYDSGWRRIGAFMFANDIKIYNRDVEKVFLEATISTKKLIDYSPIEQYSYYGAKMLTQFLETGQMDHAPSLRYTSRVYKGVIGELVVEFLEYLEVDLLRKYHTVRSYRRTLYYFSEFCFNENISSIDEVDLGFIYRYIQQVDDQTTTGMSLIISNLRSFVHYWFQSDLIQFDLSRKIPKFKRVTYSKVPSIYSREEILQLLRSVDRSTKTGKRNYAMIILAAKLGLRAIDIARLKIDNIDWDLDRIVLNQHKTGKEIILPLGADVGNAIIEYLKFGRPKSNERNVFLSARPPYMSFSTSNVVTHVVQRAFQASKIKINGRRFGPHALRHSLSAELLEKRVELPVISEILGHQSTETTRHYLRIDLASMKQCMLEVPIVKDSFYRQQNGKFYA